MQRAEHSHHFHRQHPPGGHQAVSYTHLKEQLIFPEIEYDKIDKIRGMDVVICTTAHTDEEARVLLEQVGAPFAR